MSVTEIKEQLISRIAYSKKLLEFIHKVEKQNVSIEEASRVCVDILGKKSPKPIAVLLLFKPLLEETTEAYQNMVNICEGKNLSVTTAMLDLTLEDQLYTNKEIIQTFDAISAESLKWVHILTEEQAFFESMRQMLKPLLPAPYQFLKKYFSYMLYNSDFNKFDKHKKQKVNYVLNLNFDEDLCYELATQYVFKSSNETVKKKLHLIPDTEHKEQVDSIADEISTIIQEKNNVIDKYVEQVKTNITLNAKWIPVLIANTFKFYQDLSSIKNNVVAVYQKLITLADESDRKLNLLAHFKVIKPKIEKYSAQCTKQKEIWHAYIPNAPKLEDVKLKEIAQKVAISEKVLAIYFGELTKAIEVATAENNMPTAEEISQFGVFCEKKLSEIKKIASQYEQYILEHQTHSQQLLKDKLLQEALQEKEKRQHYLDQKQQCTLLWNKKVEEQRQAKKLNKLSAATVKASIELVDQLGLQEKQKNEKLALLKTVESLKHLSMHYIEFMKSIYCREKGIFYAQVYYLITNQLGGKILEHGNGSSHKTIVLNNFSTCFISSGQLPTNIKSGVYEPHGKSHQSGELCGFNLELVEEALFKAGITPEVIDLLEQNKLNHSVSKLTL